MKLKDSIWILVFLGITSLFIITPTRLVFVELTGNFPYFMGFIKTAVLASMGEMLVKRLQTKRYFSGPSTVYKFIVWGFLGMAFVLVFKLFASGVIAAQAANLLPGLEDAGFGASLLTAFLTSALMNVIFAPTFMILHRITDNYIDLGEGKLTLIVKVKLTDAIAKIDWNVFFGFVILFTIPVFWIPAHTITFLLPEAFRVLMAAYLSIALGVILTFTKTLKQKKS